jgi:hypothetical protein
MGREAPDVAYLASLTDDALYTELGKSVRASGLGMLPSRGDEDVPDHEVGQVFFRQQLTNLRKLYCTESIARLVRDEERRDVVVFVSSLVDVFAAYFGAVAGTILLVQIYKIGVDRFCKPEGHP